MFSSATNRDREKMTGSQIPDIVRFDSLSQTTLSLELAATLQSKATHRLTIQVAGQSLRVNVEREDVYRHLVYRYAELASLGDSERCLDVYITESDFGALFWVDLERVWMWPHENSGSIVTSFFADNVMMFEFFVRSAYISLHAAVLGGKRGALALVGTTTAGKSTTSVACALAGMMFFSDERCIVRDGIVYPFPRALSLRAGGRHLLLSEESPELRQLHGLLERWADTPELVIQPSRLFPGRVADTPAPLRAVVCIDSRGDTPALRATSFKDVLSQLMNQSCSAGSGLDRLAKIMHDLHDIEFYRLRLGSPMATAQCLKAVLDA